MRFSAIYLLTLAALALASCQNNPEMSCNDILRDRKQLDSIAKSVIDKGQGHPDSAGYYIWNLAKADTSRVTYYEDYFTNSQTKNTLVFMEGDAGLSAGSADNLLILFDCNTPAPTVIWAGQVGEFTPDDVRDLNKDGVKEIALNSFMQWMGECNETFDIINFKNNRRNDLYEAHSFSYLDCGGYYTPSMPFPYSKGDTLAKQIDAKIISDAKGKFRVQQITTYTIYDGVGTFTEVSTEKGSPPDTTFIPVRHEFVDSSFIDLR
jgi:hypothetical protein